MGFFSSIGKIAGGVIGSAVGAPGLGSALGGTLGGAIDGSKASSAASGASADAAQRRADVIESAADEVKTAEQNVARFESIYGTLERNLAAYFTNLTPERLAATGLEEFQTEFQDAQRRVNENLAQRGLGNSGLMFAAERDFAIQRAQTRANIRVEAEAEARNQQLNFLTTAGLPQGAAARNDVSNAKRNRTAVLGGVAADATDAAVQANQSAGNIIGDVLGSESVQDLGTIIGDIIT